MGTGRNCDVCSELASLLSSYDGKRTSLSTYEDITISREEVETIVLYLQSWSHRQCSCCFRTDHKHFERFNWAIQLLILIVVEIIKRLGAQAPPPQDHDGVEEAMDDNSGDGSSSPNRSSHHHHPRPLWDVEDKDKLVHFVAKLFLNSFPTYIGYKTHSGAGIKLSESELSPAELHNLSQYCEINEPEASPYLFRNVGLFCRVGGMEALTQCLKQNSPDSLLLHQLNMLVILATNVKSWMNFNALLKLYVPFRAAALGYMCALVETELKTGSARNMAEYIWSSVKDPVDAHLSFDKEGLDLAFRYFLCPTLTMRLAGVNQLNNYINLFNELLNSEHMREPDRLYESLCSWLLSNQIVEHIFGPNLHVEVIKQSHTILSFLAMENQLTEEHVEIIWGAAQLKHCAKPVFDVLSSLIPHMEPGPVLHLHHLLQKLEPRDHSEQSLYLASALIKFIWTNATSAIEEAHLTTSLPLMSGGSGGSIVSVPASSSSPSNPGNIIAANLYHGRRSLTERFLDAQNNQRRQSGHHHPRGHVVDVSSSENSVSVDGVSGSEDEDDGGHHHHHRIHGQQRIIKPLSHAKMKHLPPDSDRSDDEPPSPTSSYLKPTCHLSGESSSSDESLSEEDEEGESPTRSEKALSSGGGSGAYVETHSDSDADEDEPDHDVGVRGKVVVKKRKVLRRKLTPVIGNKSGGGGGVSMLGVNKGRITRGVKVVQKQMSNINTSSHIPTGATEPKKEIATPSSNDVPVVPSMPLLESSAYPIASRRDLRDVASDGSYSSRMSTKSDKNMADFDGEESPAEDVDLMSSLSVTQTQLVELAARTQSQNQVRKRGCSGGGVVAGVAGTTLLLPPRAMRMFFRRKRFQSPSTFNFQIDNVIEPGVTLLWDLIQDDKIVQLSDGLAIEAQKALTNLLCFGADKLIRLKFIEGCVRNVAANQAVVVSLRLLPKLLTSFNVNQMRLPGVGDIHQVTLWAEREHSMLDKLFNNFQTLKTSDLSTSPFPYHVHVQSRLDFLSAVFSAIGSPDDFRLSVAQVDTLWECLARDAKCSDDLFIWLTAQVRSRDQHALSHETFRHILMAKLPSHPPESITMHSLTLFQQLCNLARLAVLPDVELVAGGTPVASMDYLWKIALYAHNTDVSMMAIQYLNNYYIGRQLEKEEEFVERCMSHLAEATTELISSTPTGDESPMLRIQRALLLLKSHLEMFRRRYAYHLRKWALEGCGVGCHAQLVGDKGAVPIRVVIQPGSYHEKVTLDMSSSDYVADLRAEVAKWWERVACGGDKGLSSSLGGNSATPVLGSLLAEGPIRMITQGIELSADFDEKFISEVPIKDLQIVYVSMGASRPSTSSRNRKELSSSSSEYSSGLPPPPRDKLPVTLLLLPTHFEQLFSLMQSLAEIKSGSSGPHTKAQVLSRRVWDILMLLPTNPEIYRGFKHIQEDFRPLLDPSSPQKLMYSLYIVEALVKLNSPVEVAMPDEVGGGESNTTPSPWRQRFVSQGGLRHLFGIFTSGVLEFSEGGKDWSEWKQDCLASLLKILCYLGVVPEETEHLSELLYDVNEAPKKRVKRRKGSSTEKSPIPRLNETMISVMELDLVMSRLTNILQACSHPRDPNAYKTGFWGRAQVVHYAMALLICWSFSHPSVRATLYSQPEFSNWLRKLVLEDPEPVVRREICMGLYRLCLGTSTEGATGVDAIPQLIAHLLVSLNASLNIRWNSAPTTMMMMNSQVLQVPSSEEGKEPYGPACRDYFWLLGRLLDSLDENTVRESILHPEACVLDLDTLALSLSQAILSREYLETRHNTVCDDGLVGLLTVMNVVMKHNPPFKSSSDGSAFLKDLFKTIFALPSPSQRYLPKCKSPPARSSAYDLLAEMARCCPKNYFTLATLLLEQHGTESHNPYSWDYWPHEDGRAVCGFVGLTNLGATCYMASCMQHLYMMPQARGAILGAKFNQEANRHEPTLRELQRMFAYLMESERKAFNPRGFCKVYQMDHKPLNTGEQKDMAEFFIDLVSKLEEMTPELRKLVKNLFCGVTSNNVVSLDCAHVSRTLEEFYTVRCQVADMRNLYESLDEVTVKDTLEGDNMYTCSTCGKKVRAEKRACFKKLPRVICFNTMRYTFNMITMMKEKVNTHFSFPIQLDMSGYVEKTLMPQQYQEERALGKGGDTSEEEESCTYDLIGVTVHTGTADGGHYYSFIRDRLAPNRDKWYLFNDAEVKQFDPNQLPAECFGGEMSTKTYDSVTDKFLDFSFEKTNSAYMLFYERSSFPLRGGSGGDSLLSSQSMSLPGGSSQLNRTVPIPTQSPTTSLLLEQPPTFELSKELEDWIWMDNTQFLQDKNIFEHTYFNFMSQICYQIPIPATLLGNEEVKVLAAKLSATFFLETFIHAKEKPTMVQWMDLLIKQMQMSPSASVWILETMASPENSWLPQILLKCPNQIVRQMFGRLCLNVVQNVRPHQVDLYSKMPDGLEFDHPDEIEFTHFGQFSCVPKFIQRYLSLLDQSAKSSLKNLAEYFTFLHDFTKLGDEECLLLIHLQAISKMVNFYMGNKRDEAIARGEVGSEEEEEEEEIISIPTEKSKVASLEKMIALIATLVEKSRDESNTLKLSRSDREALMSPRKGTTHFYMFPFILQQIRDGINYNQSRNLIFSLCRWNDKLAEDIVIAIFQAIQKHPDMCHPYFKVLNLLAELVSGPAGMPKFTELILTRILDVAEICPYPTLEWLGAQVPRNKVVHAWCLSSLSTWVEHFLMANNNQRVRNAAAALLVSLVPSQQFRQGYRSTKIYGAGVANRELVPLVGEALTVLHDIYGRLLHLLKPARHYTDINSHGTSKLIAYFGVLTYFTVSKQEKLLFGPHFLDLWNLFHPRLSEPSIPCHHNKSALLTFWLHACTDCPENIQRITSNPTVVKQIGFNYILADHEDQEVVMFNRTMLPAYYSILRMCCLQSRHFALTLARHQNITWAFKNISPSQTQYPAAVEELFKLMQIIAQRSPEASEAELQEITVFKRNTLQLYMQNLDVRSSWGTLISALRILVETMEDRIFVVMNNGLNLLLEAIVMLHTMHHEATACHVTGELVDLLSLLSDILRSFRPKEFAHGMAQTCTNSDVTISRCISACKDWPEVLRKLATLLNTYNCADLRNSASDTLTEFLYTMPMDTLRTLGPLMVHWHTACQDAQTSGMGPTLGPYFPKRSSHGGNSTSHQLKPTIRPPRPMLQMAFPHLGQEMTKGLDEEYDRQLQEFYGHYHFFVDLMCRVAFMKDAVNQELITLSAMLGYEAAPLHFIHFPKLWLEVYNTPSIDRKYINMLVNTTYFTDYVELVILEERTCLTNIVIFNFLATYFPKIFDKIATTDQMCKVLVSIKIDLQNLVHKQIKDVETHAMRILGDLKVISLFYLPTINGKGSTPTPLPSPAPTIPQLLSVLKQLNTALESLLNTTLATPIPSTSSIGDNRSDSPGTEAPSKKRKLTPSDQDDSEPQQQQPGPSSSLSDRFMNRTSLHLTQEVAAQKRSITRDLINLLLGTIDTLVRGISPPSGDEDVEEEETDSGIPASTLGGGEESQPVEGGGGGDLCDQEEKENKPD